MAQSRIAAPGGILPEEILLLLLLHAQTLLPIELEIRLAAHAVIAVFGELKPAMPTAGACRLFARHFNTPLSSIKATCHGPCEFFCYSRIEDGQGGASIPWEVSAWWHIIPADAVDSPPASSNWSTAVQGRACRSMRTTSSPLLLSSPGRPWSTTSTT
jgi:hypothetical protein